VTTQHSVGAFALSGLSLLALEQENSLLQVAGMGALSLVAIAKLLDTDHQRGHAQAYRICKTASWLRRHAEDVRSSARRCRR